MCAKRKKKANAQPQNWVDKQEPLEVTVRAEPGVNVQKGSEKKVIMDENRTCNGIRWCRNMQGLAVSYTILSLLCQLYLFLFCAPAFFVSPMYMSCCIHFVLSVGWNHDLHVAMKVCLCQRNYDVKSVSSAHRDLLSPELLNLRRALFCLLSFLCSKEWLGMGVG